MTCKQDMEIEVPEKRRTSKYHVDILNDNIECSNYDLCLYFESFVLEMSIVVYNPHWIDILDDEIDHGVCPE